MELSINPGYVRKRYEGGERPILDCIRAVRDAGFSLMDFLTDVKVDTWENLAKETREEIERMGGIAVDQSHAPFNRYTALPEELFAEHTRRAVEAAAILGSKNLVVHADEYVIGEDGLVFEKALAYEYERLAPIVSLAEKRGVNISIECLFEDGKHGNIPSRFTSRIEELLALVEKLNAPNVSICWDFGHGYVANRQNHLDALRRAAPYLGTTHVHDNDSYHDLHRLPLFGTINWCETMKTLREIGYRGNFTFELVYEKLTDGAVVPFLSYCHALGEELLRLSEL